MAEIRIENLTKHFGDVHAVEDLNLVAEHGSFIALLGPSGCGKTTTMNMLSGLEKPTGGEIYFDGYPITKIDPGKRNVGFVFQNYAIFTHMTVYENLAFGLRAKKPRPSSEEIDGEVKRVAETVGLAEQLQRSTARLSVNDLQKVALGRSMIMRPAIFLLDEPFSNLDAAFRAYMRAELKRIQHEVGQTMVYVTHDQVEAMGMADRIAVMNLGVLQQFGTPHELYNLPENRFVANFIGSVLNNFLPAVFETTGGAATVRITAGDGRPLDVADRRAGIESTVQAGGTLTLSIRPELVTLVAPDAPEAVVRASVAIIEPLGPKDIVHMTMDGYDVRAVAAPDRRPTVGDNVGLAFEAARAHLFDDETGLVLR
ncbi:MAG: ABC transporter ATP-binding protein [Gaiellales bacterium]